MEKSRTETNLQRPSHSDFVQRLFLRIYLYNHIDISVSFQNSTYFSVNANYNDCVIREECLIIRRKDEETEKCGDEAPAESEKQRKSESQKNT